MLWHTRSVTDDTREPTGPAPQYREASLWSKLARHAGDAGRQAVEKALQLHYAARRPDTPAWARRTAYGALAYFIMPLDSVPDWLVAVGYTDDLAALALAVSTLSAYIDEDVRQQARARLTQWFGE